MNKSDPAAATIAIPAIVKSAIPLPPVAGRSNPLLLTTVSGTIAVSLPLSAFIVTFLPPTYADTTPSAASFASVDGVITITTGSFRRT